MYIKIKSKDLYQLEKAQDAISEIVKILQKSAEVDTHGNSSYKADKPLKEITDVLYFADFISNRHIIPEQEPEKELQVICR